MSSKERIGIILDVDAEVSKAKGNISSLSKIFDGIGGSKGNQLRNILSDISAEYDKLADQSGKTMNKIGDFTKVEKSSERLSQLLRRLDKEISNINRTSDSDLSKFFPAEIAERIKKTNEAIKIYNTSLKNSEKSKGAIGQATSAFQEQIKVVEQLQSEIEQLEKAKKNGTPVSTETRDAQRKTVKNAEKRYNDQLAKVSAAQEFRDSYVVEKKLKQPSKSTVYGERDQAYKKELEQAERLRLAYEKAQEALNKMYVPQTVDSELDEIKKSLEQAKIKADEFEQNLNDIKATEVTKALEEAKKKLEGLSGVDLSKISSIEDLNNLFKRFSTEGVDGLKRGLQEAGIEIKELDSSNVKVQGSIRDATAEIERQNRALEDVDGIKNRILQFFSLTNGITLARRVISQATESIKELDAAMTETATVTDFSVGDMWDALPRYTQTANELGATTLGAYETMTLFYQQGLSTNEVFEVGTETMKMARIAGLDYADATNLMTAALRGFNMELNETSAQRINDVYSELAAITAADTNEIATAMTKTASIADSANMEFETTAALLSQIIETTREPAETAGTAMKTIIARFTEMKEATSDLINVDGEEVSVNKVEAALKSAGVALRDAKGEFRDLDDVFLELSSRWNSLDIMTQRYIATMAAGSRQQSRFIAMMQNYDRTMELVDAAYDSAGASAQQFAKTQDSFEAKMNGLTNAWNEYLMGLANSDAVKGFIVALTELLNILNDLTEGGGAFFSSLLKIFTAVAGFKVLRSAFQQTFSSLGDLFSKEGQKAGNNFSSGIQNGLHNLKIKFPFIGTLQKELRKVKKEIKTLQAEGSDITLGKMSSTLKHNPTVTTQLSGNLGRVVNNYLQQQLNEIGTLTDEGQQWANELIDGFVAELQSGTEIDQALKNLNNKINNGLVTVTPEVDTGMVDADGNPIMRGGEKTTNTKLINPINKGAPKNIDVNNASLNSDDLKDMEQKAAQAAAALATVGMAVSALGSKLSDEAGALGTFGDGLEVAGNAASSAGMALMSFNAIAKVIPKITSMAGGHLGAIIAVATAVISAVVGIIQKIKEAKEEAQQLTLDTAKESREEVEANRELVNTLDETVKAYQDGAASREEVASAAEELLAKYDLENDRLLLLTGNYEKLTEAILEKRKAEETSNIEAQSNAQTTSRAQLVSNGIEEVRSLKHGVSWGDEVEVDNKFKSKAQQLLIDNSLQGIISLGDGGTLSFSKSVSEFTDEELSKLSTFLNKYYVLLGDTLNEQNLSPEKSEVYLHLSEIIGNTSSNFEEFNASLDSAKESLINITKIDFEKTFDFSSISDYGSYNQGKQEYIRLMKEADSSLTYEQAQQLAIEYFSSRQETSAYAQADRIILELQSQFGANDLAALDVYQKYINGEISAEEFVSLLVSIDITAHTDIKELDKEVQTNRTTAAIKAPQDFFEASSSIGDYINENFTIEGIDEKVLQDFEAQLKVINGTLPSNINLLNEWNDALSQGTLGIATFMANTQSLLNEQSLLLSESAVNASVYGLGRTDVEIERDIAEYNSLKGDVTAQEQKKQEFADKYGISVEEWESGVHMYQSNIEEQQTKLENDLANKIQEQSNYYNSDAYKQAQAEYDAIVAEEQAAYDKMEDAKSGVSKANSDLNAYVKARDKFYNGGQFDLTESEQKILKQNSTFGTLMPDVGTESKYNKNVENKKAAATKAENEYNKVVADNKTRKAELEVILDKSKFDKDIKQIETAIENLGDKEHIKLQIEIEGAMRDATQIATLQTQLQQLKNLTKDGFKVDLSTFNQMKAIAPEIAHGIKVMADGTLDVSAGMEALNNQLAAQIGLKGESAKATLQQAIAEETALQGKLEAAIAAIDAELAAIEQGKEIETTMSEETEEAITNIKNDGAYQRALIADQEADDETTAAQKGANNVIATVEGMDDAYQKLGQTLDGIHAKMQAIGTKGYKAGAITGTYTFETAKGKVESVDVTPTVDEGAYTNDDVEGWIDKGDYLTEDNTAKRKKELEAYREYFNDLLDDSYDRAGSYATTLSGMLGGGNDYGTDSGSGSGSGGKDKDKEADNIEKLTALQQELNDLKQQEQEIDNAINDLMDDEIIDMARMNRLLEQKIATQQLYLAKLGEEKKVREELAASKLNEIKKKGYDKYIDYDEESQLYELNEEFYNKLFTDGVATDNEKVEEITEMVESLNSLSREALSTELEIKRLVEALKGGNADTYNAERRLQGTERRQQVADAEEGLINRLPQEIQGPLKLANSFENAWIEYDEIQATRTLIDQKQGYLDDSYATLSEEEKSYLDFNEFDGYTINREKVDAAYADDPVGLAAMYTKLEKDAEGLNKKWDEIYELEQKVDGGKIQKAFHSVSKVSKEFAKDLRKDEKSISKAFRELGEDIGFGADQLEGFGLKVEELIGDMDFKGITDEETAKKITDTISKSKIGQDIFSEEGLTGIQQLLTGGKGNEMLGAFGDVFGDLMGFGGDMLSFDMMGIGMDMFETGKGMIDQGKQMVEKIIGYITQATQVIVDAWTNREDYLYNFLKIIEKHLQEYEKLQRYSTQLEKGRLSSSQDILNNWNEQWKSLQLQLEEQQERLETRQKELERSRWNPFSLISGWNPSSDTLYENREVKFLWDLLIGFGQMAPMGLGAFFSQLNQLYEDYDKRVQQSYEDRLAAEQALLDIEDERLELVKVGSEEATEFEQKLLDAMIQKEQEQIDELTRLNDAITDANSKLISTLQDNLDKMRQDRENEKKEEELGEKERRLAYLRQDTSGANMLEIKKLEEQLEEEHEDYTDTLIDQKISELEKQNELAAEQRQQQIDLLQGQLDYAEKYGLYWDAIYGMLYTFDENGNAILNPDNFDLDGNIRENSQLAQMLGTFSDRLGMSVWSAVLDNEEVKRLGRYYGAFIGMNGVDGNWANYWALQDPGADDPNYAYPDQEIPEGLWGVLYKLEIGIKKYFANSDPDLIDRGGRMGQAFKNFFGKLFGNEEWANYKYEAVNAAHVQSTTFAGMKKLSDDTKEWFKSLFSSNESYGNKTSRNLTGNGAQNIGDINTTNYFQIGNVGETVSLDEMVDRVAEKFKDMFSIGNNVLGRSRT